MTDYCPLNVYWDPRFERYDFGPGHPFTEKSRWMAVRLLTESGFFNATGDLAPRLISSVAAASRDELLQFHEVDYLALIDRAGSNRGRFPLDGGDTPAFPGCFEAAATVVGGTLAGLRVVEEHPAIHAFQPAGGLHHAQPGRASGFCIFNDVALALRSFRSTHGSARRTAYVDIDVHHGDGVMYGFYEDGGVLDIDIHQDGRTIFPGTGFPSETGRGDGAGLKVNVPLPPNVGDEAFLPLFERIVPTMIRRYRPEIIVLQCGMDAHRGDRLGRLQYTPHAYRRAVDLLHGLAHEVCGGRLLVTGGGGYAPENVSRGLARVGARLARRDVPSSESNPLPSAWRTEFEALFAQQAPLTWETEGVPVSSAWTADRGEKLLRELSDHLGLRWDRPDASSGKPEADRE